MLIPLAEAEVATCGAKAASLGRLLRAGFPVPGGLVVPTTERSSAVSPELRGALAGAVDAFGGVPLAVRSSASDEDLDAGSAAGRYTSVLGVQGLSSLVAAVEACWASLGSATHDATMAVLIQPLVDAEVSGVLFTAEAGRPSRVEASWGLGPSVVGGTQTPDSWRVTADGAVMGVIAEKRTRLGVDDAGGVAESEVPEDRRRAPSLTREQVLRVTEIGVRIAGLFGRPQDIEWALAAGEVHVLQARPVTVALPDDAPWAHDVPRPHDTPRDGDTPPAHDAPGAAGDASHAVDSGASPSALRLTGEAGSVGIARGPARLVRGPEDFPTVKPGDILVCPFTDPAWTPLLRSVAGVVTEHGGVLSHAAIVAREHGIPAVLGVRGALERIPPGAALVVDGGAGTITEEDR